MNTSLETWDTQDTMQYQMMPKKKEEWPLVLEKLSAAVSRLQEQGGGKGLIGEQGEGRELMGLSGRGIQERGNHLKCK